jgi:putative acetyltransferase
MELVIRAEKPGDVSAIREVNDQAFRQPLEGRLVDVLRENNAVLLSLVAVTDDRVVGHILFSPVTVVSGAEQREVAGLGPMAVHPEFQRKEIGTKLVSAGVTRLRESGIPFIVVLGHPEYYPRFGFERASRYGVSCQWDVPDEAFMLLPLSERPNPGLAKYRDEFMLVT